MTEAEWLACNDSQTMLEFLRGRTSDRKLRLFAVECCRQYSFMLVKETVEALEVAEKFAEGLASPGERKRAREMAMNAGWSPDPSLRNRRGPAKACVAYALARRPYEAATRAAQEARRIGGPNKANWAAWPGCQQEQEVLQTAKLRDIVGNPFRFSPWLTPAVLAWNDRTVPRVAEGIYGGRAFDRLPILADALLDAGCDDEDLIAHCRSARPHVRGCWAVDLVLGNE